MKKTFEFILVLIIFYGVYSAFNQATPVIFEDPKTLWVIIVSLAVAALLLVLYSYIIASSAKQSLKKKVSELQDDLQSKDEELKNAFKVKKAVEDEAEATILDSESNV